MRTTRAGRRSWTLSHRVLAAAAAGAMLAVAVVGLRALMGDDDVRPASAGESDGADVAGDGSADTEVAAGDDSSASDSADPRSEAVRVATEDAPLYDARPEEIPLTVSVSDTTGLADGDPITIRVEPKAGSLAYGFTAFLCKGDAKIDIEAKVRPTNYGNCASRPLSAKSDSLVEVAAPPPYDVAQGTFRVGVGSDTFELRDGREATVTCGPSDPCQLVIKLQFPNGYGIRSFPVDFR